MDFILALTFLLVAALIGGLAAQRFKQPAVLGYLLAGIIIGAVGSRFLIHKEVISQLAEIGVAFLMFSLGIEFSLKRLAQVRQVALWGGGIQVLFVLLLGTVLFPHFGFDFYPSLFLAACFSLSSTAVVTKILFERGEIDSLPGEIMVGWLLVQDLAVLPMILILPKVANLESGALLGVILAIFKTAVLLGLVVFLGRAAVPRMMDKVAKTASHEIILLAIVGIVLLSALGTFKLGFSTALGAFLAGLILSESSQNHAIFTQIRPLRDVFAIVFFVSLGMMLTPSFLVSHLSKIIILSVLVVGIKFLVVTGLVLYLGYHTKTAFFVGMGLVSVGEFSFILSRLGLIQNLISDEIYTLTISVAILTIALTPFFFLLAPKIYAWTRKWSARRLPRLYSLFFTRFDHRLTPEEFAFKDHVVICGYGRVGSWLGRALQMAEVPQVVVDYDFNVVRELKEKEIPAIYGDPADIDVLRHASVGEAKAVVVAIPDFYTRQLVIGNILTLNPAANIICRTHHEEEIPRLKALGVKTVIQPEFEASLSIIHRLLQGSGLSKEEVSGKIKRVKIEHGVG